MSKQKRNFITHFFGAFVVVFALVWYAVFTERATSQEEPLTVTFFDVGQGDAIFIETPGGRQILIDGGPDSTVLQRLGEAMPFYDRTIDIVIATQPDADHITGLIDVLKNYNVELVIDSGGFKETDVYAAYLDQVRREGKYMQARRGDRIRIGEYISVSVLHPGETFYEKPNNNSVVSRLDYKENSFLFTGDIERQAEYELVESRQNLDTDIMQAPHHGSKTSTSELLLERVTPEFAVISVGKNNRYGHPTQAVLENLADRGVKIFRTDRDGSITISSNGEDLFVR